MIKKSSLFIVFLMICSFMTGCSLAVKDTATNSSEDQLIGAFITREYLDLFDMEAYLEDHVSSFVDGEDLVIEDDAKYEERLYASETDKDESGISFGNIEGIIVLGEVKKNENGDDYLKMRGSREVADTHIAINVTDEGEENVLTATIYTYPENVEGNIIYTNPIYQTKDGQIYVVSGSGLSTGGTEVEGMESSAKFDSEIKDTVNGESKARKTTVEVKFKVMSKPIEIGLYQMSKDHQLLAKEIYEPGKLPEKIKAKKDTAYFLIETKKQDLGGNISIEREIFEQNEEEDAKLYTYYPTKNGILTRQETEVY